MKCNFILMLDVIDYEWTALYEVLNRSHYLRNKRIIYFIKLVYGILLKDKKNM